MNLTTSLATAAVLSLALAACHSSAPNAGPPAGTPEVSVLTLQPAPVGLTTELPGRTAAHLVAEVRPQVGGILQQRLFEEGSQVKAGQALYQIDPASYRATLNRSEASEESARLLDQRYATLIQTKAISQQDRDDARSQYLQAKASADTARIDLGYTRITAPISGRIGRSQVTQGALLTANQSTALATIQQLDPIYVDIVQSSTVILKLKDDIASGRLKRDDQGQADVTLTLENGKRYPLAGKLQFSEVNVDEGTGAVTLRALFPNPDGLLLPGMYVRAQLQEGMQDQALLVPQRAIQRDTSGKAFVLVVGKGDKAEQREVVTGRTVGNDWLIESGLKAGDRVIVDGGQNAHPGAPVKVVSSTAGTATTPAPTAAPAATSSVES